MLIRFLKKRFTQQLPETRAEKGAFGEAQAAKFLKKQGYKLITQNWRAGRDEIDLVCMDGKVLVFVEVRTRDASALVSGYHTVRGDKKQALRRVCKAYLSSLSRNVDNFRFDIVEVRLSTCSDCVINHYTNVCLFTKHYQPIHPH